MMYVKAENLEEREYIINIEKEEKNIIKTIIVHLIDILLGVIGTLIVIKIKESRKKR